MEKYSSTNSATRNKVEGNSTMCISKSENYMDNKTSLIHSDWDTCGNLLNHELVSAELGTGYKARILYST